MTATSSPAKMKGSAVGSSSNRSVCHRVALRLRIRSSLSWSMLLRPTITLAKNHVGQDREERDRGGNDDLGTEAVPEPYDDQRRDGHFRYALKGDDIGIDEALDDAELRDDRADDDPGTRRDEEAGDGFREGDEEGANEQSVRETVIE